MVYLFVGLQEELISLHEHIWPACFTLLLGSAAALVIEVAGCELHVMTLCHLAHVVEVEVLAQLGLLLNATWKAFNHYALAEFVAMQTSYNSTFVVFMVDGF